MADTASCAVFVWRGDDWHGSRDPCGKRAKGLLADGTPACGVHLRVESEARRKADARTEWIKRMLAVSDALGVRCSGWQVDLPVNVSLVDLERLAERLNKEAEHG